MCLLTIFSKVCYNNKVYFEAYKRFDISENNLPLSSRMIYLLDNEMFAINRTLHCELQSERYISGFHAFLMKKDADNYNYQIEHGEFITVSRHSVDKNYATTCRVLINDLAYIGYNGNNWLQQYPNNRGLTIVGNKMVILKEDWEAALTNQVFE